MKIAIAGKGGTGKTTITTLSATYLANISSVLAFDIDSNENLAYSLGFTKDKIEKLARIRNFHKEIFEHTKTDFNWEKRKFTPHTKAKYYSFKNGKMDSFLKKVTITHENISVGHLGTVTEENRGIENMCDSYTLMRIFLNHIQEGENDFLIADLAAGNDLLTRATIMSMDEIILVVEPASKNLLVAKDILSSLKAIDFNRVYCVINKSFENKDVDLVSASLSLPRVLIYRIPFSMELLKQDSKNKLSFMSAPFEIQKVIVKMFDDIKKNKDTNNLFLQRAEALDARLFDKTLHV